MRGDPRFEIELGGFGVRPPDPYEKIKVTVCTRCRTTNQFSEQECTADCVRRVDALLTPVFHWTDEGVNSTISHVVVENSRSWVVLDADRDSGKIRELSM